MSLLEEAAIDGVPAIAIDPKGDLGNLLLTFPALAPADFRPWIDETEAARAGHSSDEHARVTAELWKKGLADWGQDGARIARLREATDLAIYTPGSRVGRPLSVLRSLTAPPPEQRGDPELMQERVAAAASSLLALLGVEADPLRSREHILLANVIDKSWSEGKDLDLPELIRRVQSPPFERVGVFDLESFYPAKDRMAARDDAQQPARFARLRGVDSRASRSTWRASSTRPRASRASRSSRSPTSTTASACSS